LCMPNFDAKVVKEALFELIKIEKDCMPTAPGNALYIRPTLIANDEVLGVHASKKYKFFIILSPVGAYYAHGLQPTKILVEENYVRASIGGTGEAKCMGNYAASLLGGELANAKGYDQALWLDGNEHKYVEEVGSMNMFFVIGDEVVTPALVGSILDGITRRSCIAVLKKYGYKVSERRISMDEIVDAYDNGQLKESFGSGTAAVISPVGLITYRGKDMVINNGEMGKITAFLYDKITGIQSERYEDEFGWVTEIK
ncbi:MAG: branched-chain amino acid aminotransferase, partial [Clostridia bacterium]|nr:branched-chain amino acid aminotransferase [Clostridia bacterium]